MRTASILQTQIAATLANLSCPIRSAKELPSQLEDLRVGCFCHGTSCLAVRAALALLHPRGFLFTNAQQIAALLATRATPPNVDPQPTCGNIH